MSPSESEESERQALEEQEADFDRADAVAELRNGLEDWEMVNLKGLAVSHGLDRVWVDAQDDMANLAAVVAEELVADYGVDVQAIEWPAEHQPHLP